MRSFAWSRNPGSAGVPPASLSQVNGAGAPSLNRLRARLTGLEWRLIEDHAASGAWNMAVDDALLEAARCNEAPPTLRLYDWSQPTLSLGRHQDPRAGIDHEYRRSLGIDLVRRPTGGRAVLHAHEVTYSITLPAAIARGAGVGDVYCVLSGALLAGLHELLRGWSEVWAACVPEGQPVIAQAFMPGKGAPAPPVPEGRQNASCIAPNPASCFATAAGGDGLLGGRKLVGSAQARRAGAVLQHGSVLLTQAQEDWVGLFGSPGLEATLGELVDPPPGVEDVRRAFQRGLEGELGARLVPGELAGAERAEAERLQAVRYKISLD